MSTNPSGFNPMRWNCAERGCYNVKHRPKIEMFAECWPGRISMGDIDGIVEISGNCLLLEWKSAAKEIPGGQRIMYQRITRGWRFTVLCVAGDAETMVVSAVKWFVDGKEKAWKNTDMPGVKMLLKRWCTWAQKNPRIA